MRTSGRSVGPRGITLLLVTAVAGMALASHGWLDRTSGVAPGALGGASSSAASPGGGSPAQSNAARVGPTLSSQSFAPYAFLVWPGPQNAAAKSAMTGLSITVHRTGSGISVGAGVMSQRQAPSHSYVGGARVYVVEATLGDEAGNSDYNLGDDGVVVTDAHGRIVQ
ncbi:MAG: hypothetical protein ACXVGC_03500 [Mycobacteriaceae bacterium]